MHFNFEICLERDPFDGRFGFEIAYARPESGLAESVIAYLAVKSVDPGAGSLPKHNLRMSLLKKTIRIWSSPGTISQL